ncbi:coiled-coil domain-containing protein 174 [Ischnura elegans]|uniref:coiled-coil domain-containing protein 174 n=1 Tax=Ischnura elegans TaxID=197161 RepID=UPI001ED8B96E|nr:coiled-coil domain-containing protein 174 [Ischnura elegans]
MKSSKKIDVFSKSALVNLKAELSKKQEEARQARLRADGETVKPTQIPQKVAEFSRKNQGVDARSERDVEQIAEEEASIKKSKAALEEKAKLYEKLSQGQDTGDSENESRYLVDFGQKSVEKASTSVDSDHGQEEDEEEEDKYDSDDYDRPSDPEEDWVDYRDCLGRTRRCLRKDLPFVKMKDTKLADSLGMGKPPEEIKAHAPVKQVTSEPSTSSEGREEVEPVRENLELMSEDMRKQELRQKWEQQEAELREKSDVHYQDVLFDEVRSHGVAYYAFSREEKTREAEQEELRKLRAETEKGQAAASELRARRQEQMAARLKAARARKRAREGLPPEPEEEEKPPEKEEDETLTVWPDCKAAEVVKAEEEERLRRKAKLEEAEEKRRKRLEKRPLPVRPWDMGKEGVAGASTSSADPMSQEEWVKKKREERPQEFAPPPEYKGDDLDDFMATDSGWNTSHLRATSKKSRGGKGSGQVKWKKGNVSPKYPPSDPSHSSAYKESLDGGGVDSGQRKGAEIAPPPTFDYYGPSASKTKPKPQGQASLDDAISAGLSYLRQQAEDRDKQKEKGLLDII